MPVILVILLLSACTINAEREMADIGVRVEADCTGPCAVIIDGKRQQTKTNVKKEMKKP